MTLASGDTGDEACFRTCGHGDEWHHDLGWILAVRKHHYRCSIRHSSLSLSVSNVALPHVYQFFNPICICVMMSSSKGSGMPALPGTCSVWHKSRGKGKHRTGRWSVKKLPLLCSTNCRLLPDQSEHKHRTRRVRQVIQDERVLSSCAQSKSTLLSISKYV